MTDSPPRLSRKSPAPNAGLVHLGLGAFFRAHGAIVIEDAVQASGGDWGIVGVSLNSPRMRDSLCPQGCVYTAVEMSPHGHKPRVVKILNDVVFAPDDPDRLLDRMADPGIKIVSMTVTEKGYCHIPSTGEIDESHLDIQQDIENLLPKTAVGYLVRALQRRYKAGIRPFTVLSCDNLPDNGRVTRNVVIGLANKIAPDLAEWIEREGRFPSTMVDRIVPATTDQDIRRLEETSGTHDAAPVFHEPFLQWAIENRFVDDERPPIERVQSVQLVERVAPFEAMKIRMLNGTHSSLAYLGYLAGYETISDTVGDPDFRKFVKRLWREEIIPTVVPPTGTDLQIYADELLDRYSNPAILHRTWQIAMDGSQKLPQRVLGTIRDNLNAGLSSDGLILAVAAWMRYIGGVDEKGQPIDVKDPLAATLRALSDSGQTEDQKVENLLSVKEIFGETIPPGFGDALKDSYKRLTRYGALRSVQAYIALGNGTDDPV